MNVSALIPARYASTRFPSKLVQALGGYSVIQRTYQSTLASGLFDQVIVVTDHQDIADQILAIDGQVIFSQKAHESGSDRIAEAAHEIDTDIIVNVQGDEPFQDKSSLSALIAAFNDPHVDVASMMFEIDEKEAGNPNAVKVVIDKMSNALYFSRSPIPFNREKRDGLKYWKHIGIYAYRKELLMAFTSWEKSFLEETEMLEQLRLLEAGVKIKMVPTKHQAIAIDTAEDLEQARVFLKKSRRDGE
ncbi:3-deoxy-manno-octulosonate cytidylyltransferase (CMP-KDO synthetase) [Belliella buryatensis]|uniref:3-deoxy-manno-octulosonate cytidylyltransferase n=1 Tax=Belliella buryatensis TaxID=1500549 RepID=A0A239GJP3_9BACT|nr:3-deoxy-manno-octulosonate cytidylyltransferase [Belliella buryatensis]SNS69387.1 3-deoxy-manno-octulosonate cytidylyltransferase (CMP-KDO synthetase) [Belliella buryatensis]